MKSTKKEDNFLIGTRTSIPIRPMPDAKKGILSSSGLKNINFCSDEIDFRFVIGKKEIRCSHFQAQFISPKISKILKNDKTVDNFIIDVSPANEETTFRVFQQFENMMKGEEFSFNENNIYTAIAIAKSLENTELVSLLDKNIPLTVKNILKKLLIHESEENFAFLAENLYQMKIKEIPFNILYSALGNSKLKITSDDWLLDEIINSNFNKEEKLMLTGFIEVGLLSKEGLEKFINYIKDPQNITVEIWNSIRRSLTHEYKGQEKRIKEVEKKEEEKKKENKDIQLNYDGSDAFNGIFNYLRSECGGNPITKNVVGSFVQNEKAPANVLLDYSKKDNCWYLPEIVDNYFSFDFKEKTVSINGYSIRSGGTNSYWQQPVSFAIEGSNNNSNWETIDEKRDNTELGADLTTHTWKCKESEYYRYVRFRLLKKYSEGGLYTSLFELFGTLKKQ